MIKDINFVSKFKKANIASIISAYSIVEDNVWPKKGKAKV